MKNRLFVNNNTIILFLFIIGSFLFIELNFRYWYRFLEQYMMFQTTGSYFQDRLAEPGGLNEYVTEFLSLAFIHPYGASVVIALLLGLISGCFFLYLIPCSILYLHLLLAAARAAALHIIVIDTAFYFLDSIFQGTETIGYANL